MDCPENRDKIAAAGWAEDWTGLKTTFVNAASLTVAGVSEYKDRPVPANIFRQPIVVDISRDTKEVVSTNIANIPL